MDQLNQTPKHSFSSEIKIIGLWLVLGAYYYFLGESFLGPYEVMNDYVIVSGIFAGVPVLIWAVIHSVKMFDLQRQFHLQDLWASKFSLVHRLILLVGVCWAVFWVLQAAFLALLAFVALLSSLSS